MQKLETDIASVLAEIAAPPPSTATTAPTPD